MFQHFSYYLEIICIDGERHVLLSDNDFQYVQDKFFKLAELELPVSISYDSWWTKEKDKE